MGFFRGLGKMVKPLVNVPKWMDAKRITADASFISLLIKRILKPQKATIEENFEESLVRLKLTENDLKDRYIEFRRLATIFFIVSLLLIGYLFYLIFDSTGTVSWRAIVLSSTVFLIAFVQFLRFHYWVFQIKKRKLGCSFKEYFLSGILGIKS